MRPRRIPPLLAPFLLLLVALPASAAWDEFLVLASDYLTLGHAAAAARHGPWTVQVDLEEVGPDPVARWHEGLYYVVNRGGSSNLQVLDPQDGYRTVRQFGLGAGRGPADIAFRGDGLAFVSCYETAELLKVDPVAGTVLAIWSTVAWADADGIPETGWMQAVDDRLYIACQRLDRDNYFTPVGGSCLLVFDMVQESWVDAVPGTPEIDGIDLAGENPSARLELSGDRTRLRVACTGFYGALDGGVETIDLAILAGEGFEITEAELGGDLLDLESTGPDEAWVIVSDPLFTTSIRRYARATRQVTVVDQAAAYVHADIACEGAAYVYACDRTAGNAGLRVYDAASGIQLTTGPIPTGQPPHMVVLPRDEALSGVPGTPPRAVLALDAPWPNPANPAAQLRLRGPAGAAVSLRIHDLRGRRVRSATLVLDDRGQAVYAFDGRDARGRDVASGVYGVVVEGAGARATRRLALVR